MNLSEFRNLTPFQQIIFEEAYRKSKLEPAEYICLGGKVKVNQHPFKVFIDADIFHKDTLKFCSVVRLTKNGEKQLEEIYKEKQKQ